MQGEEGGNSLYSMLYSVSLYEVIWIRKDTKERESHWKKGIKAWPDSGSDVADQVKVANDGTRNPSYESENKNVTYLRKELKKSFHSHIFLAIVCEKNVNESDDEIPSKQKWEKTQRIMRKKKDELHSQIVL